MPQKRSQKPKSQNFHFFGTVSVAKQLDLALRCRPYFVHIGLAINCPCRVWGDPLNFGPSLPFLPGRPTPKMFPQFFKNLRGGVQIFWTRYTGTPKGRQGQNFGNCTLAHFGGNKKNRKFCRKSPIFRLKQKIPWSKKLCRCARVPSISGPKCTPRFYTRLDFGPKNSKSRSPQWCFH